MKAPFDFSGFYTFSMLSIFLLLGFIMRAKIKFFQKFLIPGSLLGAAFGALSVNTLLEIDYQIVQGIAYHFFNISFIAIGLIPSQNSERENSGKTARGALWMALTQGVTFPTQAVIGGLGTLLFIKLGYNLHEAFGFLVPLGFNEGPGQALSFGKSWEQSGFLQASSVGLAFAIGGFFFSFFLGLPIIRWGIARGWGKLSREELEPPFLRGFFHQSEIEKKVEEGDRVHPSNIHPLAFQAAIVGTIYLFSYLLVWNLSQVLPSEYARMGWAFLFMFGLGLAFLARGFMNLLGIGYLLDGSILGKVVAFSVDYLIIAAGVGIQLSSISLNLIPLAVISLIAGISTAFCIVFLGRNLEENKLHRIVAIYGTVTGTVSCGLLLLRIIDPGYRTSVAKELGIMNAIAVPIVGGFSVLINAPFVWGWSTLETVGVFGAISVIFCAAINAIWLGKGKERGVGLS